MEFMFDIIVMLVIASPVVGFIALLVFLISKNPETTRQARNVMIACGIALLIGFGGCVIMLNS